MKTLEIGDTVNIDGQSSFCQPSTTVIIDIKTKYDEETGAPYKVYVTTGNHRFDGRNGWALNPPTAYYMKELQEDLEVKKLPPNEIDILLDTILAE